MASDFVQVQADGPGKKVQTFKNTIGPDDVEAQAVVAVDATGAPISPALDATLTSGAQKAIARGGAKGSTAAADITSTPSGANHQGQDVVLYDGSGNLIDPRSIRALTSADIVTAAQGAAAAIAAAWPVKPTDGTNSQGFTTASEGKVNAPDATVGPSNLSANGQVTLQLGGNKSSAGMTITGTWTGTVTFEGTVDGSNWFQVTAFGALSGLAFQSSTANANFTFMVGGLQAIRANLVWASGTATFTIRATSGPIGNLFAFARIQDPTNNGPIAGVSAKGTQASNFLGVQEAKDSGRVNIAWTAEVAGAATTEGLLTVTESRDGAATTTFTSKLVTSGKRLRITSVAIAVETLGTGTAPQRCYLRLRFNTAGAVIASSPQQTSWECINNNAIVKSGDTFFADVPDGFEFLGDGTKQIGLTIQFPDWVTTTATVQAKITITAFEY